MAPVTVDSGAIAGAGSGITGWSAKDMFLIRDIDQYRETQTTSIVVGTAGNPDESVAFTTASAYSLEAVSLYLTRNGTPTDNVYVTVEGDSGGSPDGSPIATSEDIDPDSVMAAGAAFWNLFTFSSPPSLSSGTTYHLVLRRDGATHATNNVSWHYDTSVANKTFVTYKTSRSLYKVTQDSALHVWKSTDNGASWSELNSAGAPSVNSSTKPFSADYQPNQRLSASSTGAGINLWVLYFSGTNTLRLRGFGIPGQAWRSSDANNADITTDADFNRPVRCVTTQYEVNSYFTSLADDADLRVVRYFGSINVPVTLIAVNSTEASTLADVVTDRTASTTGRLLTYFYYNAFSDAFGVGTTTADSSNTQAAVDSTGADDETEHVSANYYTYPGTGSVDTAVVAFIDSDGTLEERTAQLEVSASSIALGTQHEVSSSTSYAGRSLASCKFGSDLFIFACTGSVIDVFRDAGAAGSWSLSNDDWLSGLTNAVISSVVPITGVGVLVSYTDNGDSKVNLWTNVVNATGTVSSGTLSVSGQSITGTTGGVGTVNTGSHAVSGQTVTGTPVSLGSVAIGSHAVSGQTIAGTAGAEGDINTGSHAISGQAVSATSGSVGSVATGTHAVSGQTVTGTESQTGTVATGTLAVTGQTITGTSGSEGDIATGAHAVSGQTINADPQALGAVSSGELRVSPPVIEQRDYSTASAPFFGYATVERIAQSFTTTGALSVQSVSMVLGKDPDATDGVALRIETDNAGEPSGTAVDTSHAIPASEIADILSFDYSTLAQRRFSFAQPVSLSSATRYWLVLERTGALSSDVYSAGQTLGESLIGERSLLFNGSAWTTYSPSTRDLAFGLFVGDIVATAGSIGAVATGSHVVSGQTVTGNAGAECDIGTGTHAVSGQTVTGTTGSVGAIGTGSHVVSGQTIQVDDGGNDETGVVDSGELAVSGQTITGVAGSEGDIATGTLAVEGQTVMSTYGSVGVVDTGSHVVTGQSVEGTTGTECTIATGDYAVTGQTVEVQWGFDGIVETGVLVVGGQPVSATYGSVAVIESGAYAVEGQAILGIEGLLDYLDWAPIFIGPRRSNELALSGVGSDFTGPRRGNDFEME
jgi:hypothetical protein